MKNDLYNAFEESFQRLQRGEPLESILARYPHYSARLRPLLELSKRARFPVTDAFPAAALARQRSRGLALADGLRLGEIRLPFFANFWNRAITVFSIIVILSLGSNGLLMASAHSLPGDSLYPLKRSVESTQLQFTFDAAGRLALEKAFSQRRLDETRTLISDKRSEKVEFNGIVSGRDDGKWVVSGIPVLLTDRTDVDDDILIGDEIDVQGTTGPAGDVNATRLTLALSAASDDQSIPTPTLTAPTDSSGGELPPQTSAPSSASSGEYSRSGGDDHKTDSTQSWSSTSNEDDSSSTHQTNSGHDN